MNRRNQNIPIHLSLGIGIASQTSFLQDALRKADQAMYEDKLRRKGRTRDKPTGPTPTPSSKTDIETLPAVTTSDQISERS